MDNLNNYGNNLGQHLEITIQDVALIEFTIFSN